MNAPITTPRERPILFSGPMVRRVDDGSKTQTRRLVGLPELHRSTTPGYDWAWRGQAPIRSIAQQRRHPHGCWQDVRHAALLALCPYGVVGDRLWVRETHARVGDLRTADPGIDALARGCFYRADHPRGLEHDDGTPLLWRPSIFMRREDSRFTLEITSVRLERLHEITAEDARAEGLSCLTKDGGQTYKFGIPDRDGWPGNDDDGQHWSEWKRDPREAFAGLWDSINGARAAWASNPWIWVVSFRRVG